MPFRPTVFDIVDECKHATPKAVRLLERLVEEAHMALNQGGGNTALIGFGYRAAQTLIAYSSGLPVQRHEHTGEDGGPIEVLDVKSMSDDVIRALLKARKKEPVD